MQTLTNDRRFSESFKSSLSDSDFAKLSEFIHAECGIKMPPSKKIMLESRLQKRLRVLGMNSFRQYCDYIFSPQGMESELIHTIDVITTNKTDFFREPNHFDYLVRKVLPEMVYTPGKKLTVWSAGCSTGEEPYTLAMLLSDYAEKHEGGHDYLILATDISTRVLEKAKLGVYDQSSVAPVPHEMKKKYLLKSRNREKHVVRIAPELRAKVKFRRLNFLEGDFGMREPMDIIFCRNVIIYFDRATQERLLNRFYRHLAPGGYVFLGHSETLNGLDVPLRQAAPTIYRKEK